MTFSPDIQQGKKKIENGNVKMKGIEKWKGSFFVSDFFVLLCNDFIVHLL